MTGWEWLRLPSLPEGTAEEQLRAIRNYLYQLTEQLQYALSHEDQTTPVTQTSLPTEETAQALLALVGKRFDSRYVGADSWETYRRRENEIRAEETRRLAALEDRPREETPVCPVPLRQAGTLGLQREDGKDIRFEPLETPAVLLKQQPDGHWRAE